MRIRTAVACALVLVALAPGSTAAERDQAQSLTVYSSLPLSGASRPQSQAIVRGARLALEEAGGVAGAHPIRYVSLNDATPRAGTWTPERTAANARRAALDRSAIGYIGEFNSGASAISIPILNEVDMPQISPSNTAIGLTRSGPGAVPGEPDKYYPTGRQSYFRIVPNDRVQGAAVAAAMRSRGCRRVAALTDREVYGRGVGRLMRRAAGRRGLNVVLAHAIRPYARSYRGVARRVRRARVGCVAFTGITANGAVGLFRALGRALPNARFFGSDGIAEFGFTSRVPRRVARRVLLTVSTLAPNAYPKAGRDFFRRYSERYDDPNPDPFAIYGYEAMRVLLDAVAAAGPNRSAVVDRLHAMPNRAGALGTYRFDRFGDTTLRTYGVYRIRNRLLEFAGAVRAR